MPVRFKRLPKALPHNFLLEIDGAVCARFQEVAGLDAPHGTARTTVILKRGIISGPGLWDWRKQGNIPLRNGAVVMLTGSGAERGRWKFNGGRIVRWMGPELRAKDGTDQAMKVLELACDGLDLA